VSRQDFEVPKQEVLAESSVPIYWKISFDNYPNKSLRYDTVFGEPAFTVNFSFALPTGCDIPIFNGQPIRIDLICAVPTNEDSVYTGDIDWLASLGQKVAFNA